MLNSSIPTPWGVGQIDDYRGEGIAFVSTPSHGGFKLDDAQLGKIPLAWRRASFNGQGMQGWFEEDCDWSMVALTFPERFSAAELAQARATFDHFIAKKL